MDALKFKEDAKVRLVVVDFVSVDSSFLLSVYNEDFGFTAIVFSLAMFRNNLFLFIIERTREKEREKERYLLHFVIVGMR